MLQLNVAQKWAGGPKNPKRRNISVGRKESTEAFLQPQVRQLVRRLAGLSVDSDGLHLKMAAAEKGGYSDELARRQVLGSEVRTVDTVEFVE